MRRFVLERLDRNSVAVNGLHMAAQAVDIALRSRLRFRKLDRSSWRRRSNTLVLLAAGPSAAELTTETIQALERYDVVALSYGALLPVRYSLFVSEFAPSIQSRNQIALFRALSHRYAGCLDKPVCLWKHPERVTNIHHLDLPIERIPTIVVPATSRSALSHVVDRIVRLRLHHKAFFQVAGSISALLLAARARGYRRTILVGVDLSSRHYFFDDNPNYAHIGLANPFVLEGETELSRVHQVAAHLLDIEEFARRQEIAAGPGMELFVSSSTSALAEFWPVYVGSAHEGDEV